MPLNQDGRELVRSNLVQFRPHEKVKVRPVIIGVLTFDQLRDIHAQQEAEGLPRITAHVLFHGWHIYKSRVLRDGYTIEDVLDQIESAMSPDSIVEVTHYMTAIQNPIPRADRYGNMVNDRVIFECMARHPRPELFSVVPKGDVIKPREKNKATSKEVATMPSSDPPG